VTTIAPQAAPAPAGLTTQPAPVETKARAQARETAQAFEAVLIGQLTNLMMESAGEGGEFSGGHGEAMFRGVLAEKLGTEVAKRGGLGLAPAVMQEIINLQNGDKQ
jgi:Rod binding domain-containing protein